MAPTGVEGITAGAFATIVVGALETSTGGALQTVPGCVLVIIACGGAFETGTGETLGAATAWVLVTGAAAPFAAGTATGTTLDTANVVDALESTGTAALGETTDAAFGTATGITALGTDTDLAGVAGVIGTPFTDRIDTFTGTAFLLENFGLLIWYRRNRFRGVV